MPMVEVKSDNPSNDTTTILKTLSNDYACDNQPSMQQAEESAVDIMPVDTQFDIDTQLDIDIDIDIEAEESETDDVVELMPEETQFGNMPVKIVESEESTDDDDGKETDEDDVENDENDCNQQALHKMELIAMMMMMIAKWWAKVFAVKLKMSKMKVERRYFKLKTDALVAFLSWMDNLIESARKTFASVSIEKQWITEIECDDTKEAKDTGHDIEKNLDGDWSMLKSLTMEMITYLKDSGKHLIKWSRQSMVLRDMKRAGLRAGLRELKAMCRAMMFCFEYMDRKLLLKPKRKWDGKKGFKFRINGLSDASFASIPKDKASVTGYCVFLEGAPIAEKSRKQPIKALSVTEAELFAAVECAQEMMSASRLIESLGLGVEFPMILEDHGAKDLAHNWNVAGRTRHVDLRLYWLRELKEKNVLVVKWLKGSSNCSDLFTKNLDGKTFDRHTAVFCSDSIEVSREESVRGRSSGRETVDEEVDGKDPNENEQKRKERLEERERLEKSERLETEDD